MGNSSVYCIIPIFSKLTNKQHTKIFKVIVTCVFMFSIINTIFTIFNIATSEIFNRFSDAIIYISYLILGYLLSTERMPKMTRIIIYILGIVSIIVLYTYISMMSAKDGMLNIDLFKYTTPFIIIMAAAVFVLVKNINWEVIVYKLHIKPEQISKISSCSFGIYLMHMLIINRLTYHLELNIYSIWYRTFGVIVIYLLCLFIVYIIKKIPILKKIIP